MDDADYKKDRLITNERVIALLLVMVQIALAYWFFGIGLVRTAVMIFAFPLGMVWFPDLFSKLPEDTKWQPVVFPSSAQVMRFMGWFIIPGVPLSWFLCFRLSMRS
jgi:hypothetical protein